MYVDKAVTRLYGVFRVYSVLLMTLFTAILLTSKQRVRDGWSLNVCYCVCQDSVVLNHCIHLHLYVFKPLFSSTFTQKQNITWGGKKAIVF